LPTPFSPAGEIFVPQHTAQVSVGEDQFHRIKSFNVLQAENTKKQVFFVILQFIYANLTSLW
jgi:hypothetical protein